jgi:hypothetical protein
MSSENKSIIPWRERRRREDARAVERAWADRLRGDKLSHKGKSGSDRYAAGWERMLHPEPANGRHPWLRRLWSRQAEQKGWLVESK